MQKYQPKAIGTKDAALFHKQSDIHLFKYT
jgi:hypothetical protein